MNDSKLLALIKSFSSKELKQLQKWVHSPVHNEQKMVSKLFDSIFQTAPKFMHTRLSKERVFKELDPTSTYNDVRMRRLMSDLLQVCEAYIVWLETHNKAQQPLLLQLEYYQKHQLPKHFQATLRELQKKQRKPKHNSQYFLTQYQLEYQITQYIEGQGRRTTEPNLQLVSDNLDAYYLINKLKCCCSIFNFQNLANADYQLPLLDEVLTHLNQEDYSHQPIIQIYHHGLLTLIEPEEQNHFQQLKKILLENLDYIEKNELREMFVLARNYCIKRANQGDRDYLHDLLEFYKKELDLGILIRDGELSPFTFKNMVTLGLRLEEFEWTQAFIENYQSKLSGDLRESTYAFNMARLHFEQKAFEKVIPFLHQVESKEIFLELASKNMLMRTYYELGEYEVLLSMMDSFQIFLKRKKQLNYHRTGYFNLIKAIRQLIRLEVANPKKIAAFKIQIQQTKEIIEKDWLLTKLEKL